MVDNIRRLEIALDLLEPYLKKDNLLLNELVSSALGYVDRKIAIENEFNRTIQLGDVLEFNKVRGGYIKNGRIYFYTNDKRFSYSLKISKSIILDRIKNLNN